MLSTLRRLRQDDRGAIAVLTAALALPILIACAALGIDYARWEELGARQQRTADAAALAAATHLPTSPTTAFAVARDYAAKNGFRDGVDGVTVTPAIGDRPNEITVRISTDTANYFGAAIGRSRQRISRDAAAAYNDGLVLGSMCNLMGAEPNPVTGGSAASSNCVFGRNPNFYLTTDFPGQRGGSDADFITKNWGDRYGTRYCTPGDAGCRGTLRNFERKAHGYFYRVRIEGNQSRVVLQAFDPALVATGSRCEHTDKLPAAWPYNATPNPYVDDAIHRYDGGLSQAAAGGSGLTWCTGDHAGGNNALTNTGATVMAVRRPGTSPDPMSGSVVCANRFRSWAVQDLPGRLRANQPNYTPGIAQVWRQWVPICTLNNPAPGDYWIQVRTDITNSQANWQAAIDSYADQGSTATGVNGYSLRAVVTGNPRQVSVAAHTSFTVSTNQTGTGTYFLTRVDSGQAGRNLVINLFDPADVNGATATVRILGPAGTPFATLNGCTGGGNSPDQNGEYSVVRGALSNCEVTGMTYARYNGKIQRFVIPIPSSYRCNDTDPTACWFRIQYRYSGGGQVFDTTTVDTILQDDPVRIIE